jgi:hypothetical protein
MLPPYPLSGDDSVPCPRDNRNNGMHLDTLASADFAYSRIMSIDAPASQPSGKTRALIGSPSPAHPHSARDGYDGRCAHRAIRQHQRRRRDGLHVYEPNDILSVTLRLPDHGLFILR